MELNRPTYLATTFLSSIVEIYCCEQVYNRRWFFFHSCCKRLCLYCRSILITKWSDDERDKGRLQKKYYWCSPTPPAFSTCSHCFSHSLIKICASVYLTGEFMSECRGLRPRSLGCQHCAENGWRGGESFCEIAVGDAGSNGEHSTH